MLRNSLENILYSFLKNDWKKVQVEGISQKLSLKIFQKLS